jgi:hypothetical protein
MKIINLKEFRKLPAGTIFMKYEPCVFGHLMCKGETWEYDFLYENISYDFDAKDSGEWADKLFLCEEEGESITLDFNIGCRDGMFEEGQLFAVYEKKDIEGLITKLKSSLTVCHE